MKPRLSIKQELLGTALIFAVFGLVMLGLQKIFEVAFQ